MSEVARAVNRLAEAVEVHNRQQDSEFERELAATRDVPRIIGAVRRGLVRTFVRNGLFLTAIPRAAWKQEGDAVLVRCNCGAEHRFAKLPFCERVECGRYFLHDGEDLRVGITPSG